MMKKIFFFICLLGIQIVCAQDYTTTWPFLFQNFQEGTVFFKGEGKTTKSVNIHLAESKLYFLDGEDIKIANTNDIIRLESQGTIYFCIQGQMIKVLKMKGENFLGLLVTIDFLKLHEGQGAYGSAVNTTAATKVSSINAGLNSPNYLNYTNLQKDREDGQLLPLLRNYCLIVKDKLYIASRKKIEAELSPEGKTAFKNFLKKNKIKWKDENSLYQLLDFFQE